MSNNRRRPASRLTIEHFAQIRRADLRFGDLTVLVGAQGTGKSLALQWLKAAIDGKHLFRALSEAGHTLSDDETVIDLVFGDGMGKGWGTESKIRLDGKPITPESLARRGADHERAFFIPAQRSMLISDGWASPFQKLNEDVPVVARIFSQTLFDLFSKRGAQVLFPADRLLKKEIREQIDDAVFHSGEVSIVTRGPRRSLRLAHGESELPYMTWTAGQREFTPMLLGLYHLLPQRKRTKREEIDWAIIEEPEMGLHPQAVSVVVLLLAGTPAARVPGGRRDALHAPAQRRLDAAGAQDSPRSLAARLRGARPAGGELVQGPDAVGAGERLSRARDGLRGGRRRLDRHLHPGPGLRGRGRVRLGRVGRRHGRDERGGLLGGVGGAVSRRAARGRVADSLRSDSTLQASVQRGLRAMSGEHRRLVDPDARRRFDDSLDLDEASRRSAPSDPRWDYLLGDGESDAVIAFEPHPLNGGAVDAVVRKKRSAERLLGEHLRDGNAVRRWFWVTSGGGSIPKGSPQQRKLTKAGIRFVGRRFGTKDLDPS